MSYSLIIKDGKIVDGTGSPWFYGDIGIKNGEIAKIGRIDEKYGERIINAEGLIVSPGFVDIHAHDDVIFFHDPFNKNKLSQGVTTSISGNCGRSSAPINHDNLELLKDMLCEFEVKRLKINFIWNSFKEYLDELEKLKPSMNMGALVGFGTVRLAVMGMKNSAPTPLEMEEMKRLVAQSMEGGALGLSTGLFYPPDSYSKTEEIIELAKVVKRYGGIYSTHMRDEADFIEEAIDEALRIGREADIPVQISHFKLIGKKNWGKFDKVIEKIDQARDEGINVAMDEYPYIGGQALLASLLPDWIHEGGELELIRRLRDNETRKKIKKYIEEDEYTYDYGKEIGWENVFITSAPKTPQFACKTIKEIAAQLKIDDGYEVVFNLVAENGVSAQQIIFIMSEENMVKGYKYPYMSVASDAIPDAGVPAVHPRATGTFPRFLGRYVRDGKLMNLEEGIRRMTSLPAGRYGLNKKGLIKEGFDADITIFDYERIIDNSTYIDSKKSSEGINTVIVNGVTVFKDKKYTGQRPGKILRKNLL